MMCFEAHFSQFIRATRGCKHAHYDISCIAPQT